MQHSFQTVIFLLCLAAISSFKAVGAWNAEFFSEELGCGGPDTAANSTSLAYTGPDLDDALIPQLMPCLDLGAAIEDPLVDCTAHMDLSEAGPTGTGNCEGHEGFVGKSVTVTNMLFCLGWEQPGCTGDIYYTWTPDNEKQTDGCHPGLRVRSFKCLQ
ncbi:hypothetical protein F4801DRAFT_129307 [Xylaria longipes]|nr:hypothetical protein F4801DRAFT_129307 [Xylaria longipes]RYC64249.1 hypothetical protein CHU98_g1948 [Xylaria longipes]